MIAAIVMILAVLLYVLVPRLDDSHRKRGRND